MSGVGGEPPDFFEGSLEPRDHRVEGPGEAAQFVFGTRFIKATVQPRGGDFGRRGRHPIDGGEGLAGQPVSARDRAGQGKRPDRQEHPHQLAQGAGVGSQAGGHAQHERARRATDHAACQSDRPEPIQGDTVVWPRRPATGAGGVAAGPRSRPPRCGTTACPPACSTLELVARDAGKPRVQSLG